jgi:hypothetical protein
LVDLLVGRDDGKMEVYYNKGTVGIPSWPEGIYPYSNVDVGGYAAPQFVDIDGDGDSDLFIGEENGGINFWRNMTEHLLLFPSSKTIGIGEEIAFQVLNATGTPEWDIIVNKSGAIISSSGHYTSGTTAGQNVFDVVEVSDYRGYMGRAKINVIHPEDFTSLGKAVICAGWKGSDDPVWHASNYLSQLANRTCLIKGFGKSQISYFPPVISQDVDGNGNFTDDIYGESTWYKT